MQQRSTNKPKRYNWKSFWLFMIISLMLAIIAVFGYGIISESELNCVETTIIDIQGHHDSRKVWITFSTPNGQSFYLRTDELDLENADALSKFMAGAYVDKNLSVFYTSRKELLLPDLISYWGYNRVVAIACDGHAIIELKDYNEANFVKCLCLLLISFLGVLIGLFLLFDCRWLLYFPKRH